MLTYQLGMSLAVGGAVTSLAWIILSLLTAPRVVPPELGRFEETRRRQLRQASATYRLAEPWVDEMIGWGRDWSTRMVARLRQDLPASGRHAAWHPEEYLATRQIEGLLWGVGSLAITCLLWSPTTAVLVSGAVAVLYVGLAAGEVSKRAERRRHQIRRRFASTFDLVSLMLAVGSNFQQALATVAQESAGHPLGQELERMLQDTEMGRLRGEALQAFSDRLADDDVREMMTGVIEAEKLGTPMAEILQTQVEQMRQKRIQWAEKESEESKVRLVFPAMVIMIACLVIVAAPFILDAVLQS